MTECERCGRETRDDAFGCEDCADELARDLGETPWINTQLDISITRQHSSPGTMSSGSQRGAALIDDLAKILDEGKIGHLGTPWHETASRAKRNLHATLARWVTICDMERVRHQATTDRLPAGTIPAMSRWLMWRVDGLMLIEGGTGAVTDITRACGEARRIVLWKAPQKIYLAECGTPWNGIPCPGSVYATEGDDYGHCDECNTEHEVAQRRIDLAKKLDDHLCTAADLSRMAVYLGLQAKRETVRNKVNVWHKRGRITPKAHAPNGDPMFRYGEVRSMLAASFDKSGS